MSDTGKRERCDFAGGSPEEASEGFDQGTAGHLARSFGLFHKRDWEKVNISGYTAGEVKLIMTLRFKPVTEDEGGVKVSDISKYMKVTSPTITQFLNTLEEKGLVERVMDPKDRRAVRVRLTTEGHTVAEQAHEAFKAHFRGLVDYLGEEDSRTLSLLLRKVYSYMNDHEVRFNPDEEAE